MEEKKVPMRTCVACRKISPKKELVRIVKTDGGVKVDWTGKAQGRGAYICKSRECMEKLKKRRGLNRALGSDIPMETYTRLEEDIFGKE